MAGPDEVGAVLKELLGDSMEDSPSFTDPWYSDRLRSQILKLVDKGETPPRTVSFGSSSESPYYEAPDRPLRMINNWEQRKLMMSGIATLTVALKMCKDKRPVTVVCTGALPGEHIPTLAEMFPSFLFVLYGDVEPAAQLRCAGGVTICSRPFTDDEAGRWAPTGDRGDGTDVIFICDFPSGGTAEETVDRNMSAQKKWTRIIQPRLASLKFQIPDNVETSYSYIKGLLLIQPWGHGAESRLITVTVNKNHEYDASQYNDWFFYHNSVRREWGQYPVPASFDPVGVDACHDCWLESLILKEFISVSQVTIPHMETRLANIISSRLGRKDSGLFLRYIDPVHGLCVHGREETGGSAAGSVFARRERLYAEATQSSS